MKRKSMVLALITVPICVILGGIVACAAGPETETPLCNLRVDISGPGSVTTPGEGFYTYPFKDHVTLVATPDPGAEFAFWCSWYDPEVMCAILDPTDPNTILLMANNYSIYAAFRQPFAAVPEDQSQVCCLQISSSNGGSVTSPGEGCFHYYKGEWEDLEAEPIDGYEFVYWTGGALGWIVDPTDPGTEIQIKGCVAGISAVFREEGCPSILLGSAGP